MILIDTHTHLYFDDFGNDKEALVEDALINNVKYLFFPNVNSSTIEPMLNLSDKFPETCFPMIGIHPNYINQSNIEQELSAVKKWLSEKKFYAVGEIGIDLYWDKTFLSQQETAFTRQIDLGIDYGLPLVFHSRNSLDIIINIIQKRYNVKEIKAVFHCFSGDLIQAKKIVDTGWYIGVGGVVTYKNAGIIDVVKGINLQHILIETDAPYLAPVPFRGKQNKSSYIIHIAKKIAELKNSTVEEVADVTTRNTLEFFRMDSNLNINTVLNNFSKK